MKNLMYLVLTVLVFSFAANAQSFGKKGVWEIGGSLSFTSTTQVVNDETADDSETIFLIEPYVGYFLADGFELGLIPRFRTTSFGDDSRTEFGIFLAPAYNFMLDRSNIYPFIEGRIGYNTVSVDVNDATVDLSGLSFGGRGGVKIHLGGNSLLNVGIQYMLITLDPDEAPAGADGRYGYNELAFSAGWTIFFR
jgi:hypothetical protein